LVFLPKAEFNSKSMNTYLIEEISAIPFSCMKFELLFCLIGIFACLVSLSLSLSLSLYTEKKNPQTSWTRNTLRNFTKGIFFFPCFLAKKNKALERELRREKLSVAVPHLSIRDDGQDDKRVSLEALRACVRICWSLFRDFLRSTYRSCGWFAPNPNPAFAFLTMVNIPPPPPPPLQPLPSKIKSFSLAILFWQFWL